MLFQRFKPILKNQILACKLLQLIRSTIGDSKRDSFMNFIESQNLQGWSQNLINFLVDPDDLNCSKCQNKTEQSLYHSYCKIRQTTFPFDFDSGTLCKKVKGHTLSKIQNENQEFLDNDVGKPGGLISFIKSKFSKSSSNEEGTRSSESKLLE